ncbi:hypothetical protein ANRL1_02388 [Anaerolineae bacterium]|nr:hypothetical protein ANRL1_02388 [Anaerolineae bacterium]
MHAVALDGVMPSFDTVHSGAYRVVRPIGIMVNRDRPNTTSLREFLAFLDSVFASALAEGRALVLEQAITLALQER